VPHRPYIGRSTGPRQEGSIKLRDSSTKNCCFNAKAALCLQAVGLQNQQHVRADALSGGMKRRLQVALALLGGSHVILLGTAST